MGNKRVFYACQGLALNSAPLAGVQTLSVNTNNQTYFVDEFGSYDIHEIYSDTPAVSISFDRIMNTDMPFAYPEMSFQDAIKKHDHELCLFIGDDTEEFVGSGNPLTVSFKYLSIESVSYNLDIDGNFNESIELIGYYKEYGGCDSSGILSLPKVKENTQSVYKRQYISSWSVPSMGSGELINLTIDTRFGINTVQEFAAPHNRFEKKYRYPTLPIVTTVSATTIYQKDPDIDGLFFYTSGEQCATTGITTKENLSFTLCNSGTIYCDNCILKDTSYTGGGTGGDNVTITYNYECYNGFYISGSQ